MTTGDTDKLTRDRSKNHPRTVLHGCLMVSFCMAAAGCQAPSPALFAPLDPPIQWPPQPLPARVRFVGQLTSSDDLSPKRSMMEKITDALAGSTPKELLYGPRAALSLPDTQRLWIADPGGRCLHLFDMRRQQYRKITHVDDDPWLSPVGICAGPAGSMFVCDSEHGEIYRLSSETGGHYETIQVPEMLQRPVAVHYDFANGELYIVDTGAHDIKVVGLDGTLHRIIGKRGSAPGEFNFPLAIADDGSNIWVVDTGNHRVQALTKLGEPITTIGRAGDSPGDMALPKGIALDSDGNVYVVDGRFENVQIFDRTGQLLLYIGQEGNGPGEFWLPAGIAIDQNDRIWICDLYNRRVQVFDYKSPSNGDGRSERFDRLRSMKLQTKR